MNQCGWRDRFRAHLKQDGLKAWRVPCRSEGSQRIPDLDAQEYQWRETLIIWLGREPRKDIVLHSGVREM